MQVSSRVVTTLMVVVVSAWGVTLAAQSMSRLPDEVTLTQSADSPGPVAFRHATHVDTDKPNCTSCHPREFRILKASAGKAPAIRHETMEKGRQCGACHDGRKAFAMDDCTSCHTAP